MKEWKKLCTFVLAGLLCVAIGTVANLKAHASQNDQLVDFVVEVETGRDIRVLQLTDPQIIAGEYQRYVGRGTAQWSYAEVSKHEQYVEQIIRRYKPDLIIITGDIVYGEMDDSGAALLRYIEFMDSFQIPWAPVAGNHDWESSMGADWMCQQYEMSEYCLFKQRTLTGNGNYTVGLKQGGKLKRVFFMLDSNGCGGASKASLANGHTPTSIGFGQDQIAWYTAAAQRIKAADPNTKLSFAFHIQVNAFAEAIAKYGTVGSTINIDTHANKEDTDFGYMGRGLKGNWDTDNTVFNGLKALGVDSIFVGHEHCNSASVVYQGVRLQYGQKSSTYDRANYKKADGTIVGSYNDEGEEIIGGTTIPISEADGAIVDPYILYYDPDWKEGEQPQETTVTDVYDFNGTDIDMTVTTSGVTAYGLGAVVSDTSVVPAGFTGGVASASSGYLNAIGIKFPQDVNLDSIKSMKLRIYIAPYTLSSGKSALLRLYNSTQNSILHEVKLTSEDFGKWVEIDLHAILESAKSNTTIVKDGVLQPFTLVFRAYAASGSMTVYFDSLTVERIASVEEELPAYNAVFDFNGTDFDMSTLNTNVGNFGVASVLTDTTGAPAGVTGSVAVSTNHYINATGIQFPQDINFANVLSMKLRIYIAPYTLASGKSALLRLYNSTDNTILGSITLASEDFGQWIEIDLYEMLESAKSDTTIVKDGVLQPFTLVHRVYSASNDVKATVYFDCLTIGYDEDIYAFPEGEVDDTDRPTHTEGIYDGQEYERNTLSHYGYEEIDLTKNSKTVLKVGKEAMSLSFDYYPAANAGANFTFGTDANGNGGYTVGLNATDFYVYSSVNANFTYNFVAGQAYTIEIGFVKMETNPDTGCYNGNQSYMFVKVNGDSGSTDFKGKYYHIVDIFTHKDNEYLTITATGTGATKPVLKSLIAEDTTSTIIKDWGLTLKDEILVKFNMAFTDEILADVDAYVEVKVGDKTTKVPVADIDGLLEIPVSAAQMTDEIVLCVVDGNENRSKENICTVRQYCDTILADEKYAAYQPLVKEMLNYGGYAQIYFDYNAENLANEGLKDVGVLDVPADTVPEKIVSGESEGISFHGASLLLRDKVTLRFYFAVTGDIAEYAFKVDGKEVNWGQKNGMYYIDAKDIVSQALDASVTVKVNDSLTIAYSPMNYIVGMSNDSTPGLPALVKALYNYHIAAKALVAQSQ